MRRASLSWRIWSRISAERLLGVPADLIKTVHVEGRGDQFPGHAEPFGAVLLYPVRESVVVEAVEGLAGDLVKQLGAERSQRVDLGLLDAHLIAPLVAAPLSVLQRR